MSLMQWKASIGDSPGSEPYAVVGDVVLVVRTPRSRDFVTVEVGRTSRCLGGLSRRADGFLTPQPLPCLADQWRGEVHTGDTVDFQLEGASYHLTLAHLAVSSKGVPWVTCDFCLERD